MKPRTAGPRWALTLLLLACLAPLEAGLAAGNFAYTKRTETNLLAEPKPLAPSVGTLPLGRKVKIEQAQGSWLRINEGKLAGWVFAGNLAETAPATGAGADALGLAASKTSATAAARPLSPAAEDYAGRRNLASAREDLTWLLNQSQLVSPAKIDAYLREARKGEYQ